jgi:hypothetical protein
MRSPHQPALFPLARATAILRRLHASPLSEFGVVGGP